MSDLTCLTLSSALDGLANKDFSSVELTEAFISRIDAVNPQLNA